jgi:hypothetical protein
MVMGRPTLTEEQVNKLCKDIIEWAQREDSFHLAGFALSQGKTRTWIYETAEVYSNFSDALKEAREILAMRYVSGMMVNKYNSTFGEKYLPIYDKDYKELLKWKASLQNPIDDQDKEIIIKRQE